MNRIFMVEDESRSPRSGKGPAANGFATTTVHDGYEATIRASNARST